MIPFEEFAGRVAVITGPQADELREKYIDSFVDQGRDYFHDFIEKKNSDGNYFGYLWDCIDATIIEESEMDEALRKRESVYVMWDMHGPEKIGIPRYWRFPKRAVLRMSGDDLVRGQVWLPEDIYVFDDTFSWTLVGTHESLEGIARICVAATARKAGPPATP